MSKPAPPFDYEKFAAGLHDYLTRAFKPVIERLEALEQQDAASLADAYRGTWQVNNRYARGSLTTFDGSLWLATEDCGGKPGASPGWRLVVKRGKDGKDAAA